MDRASRSNLARSPARHRSTLTAAPSRFSLPSSLLLFCQIPGSRLGTVSLALVGVAPSHRSPSPLSGSRLRTVPPRLSRARGTPHAKRGPSHATGGFLRRHCWISRRFRRMDGRAVVHPVRFAMNDSLLWLGAIYELRSSAERGCTRASEPPIFGDVGRRGDDHDWQR